MIPVINCLDFACVKKRLAQIDDLGSDWAHIDVSDGKFTPVKTWGEPQDFEKLKIENCLPAGEVGKLEIHLMVERPEEVFESWLKAGARPVRNHARASAPEGPTGRAVSNGVKRIIVHLESFKGRERELNKIFEKCAEENAEVMLAIGPKTPAEDLMPYLDSLLFAQILAVAPGFSGQHFQENVIEKIRFLRERAPELTIEVDGGMNPKTAKLVRAAGANIITTGSFIFKSENPKKAYDKLRMDTDDLQMDANYESEDLNNL